MVSCSNKGKKKMPITNEQPWVNMDYEVELNDNEQPYIFSTQESMSDVNTHFLSCYKVFYFTKHFNKMIPLS